MGWDARPNVRAWIAAKAPRWTDIGDGSFTMSFEANCVELALVTNACGMETGTWLYVDAAGDPFWLSSIFVASA